MGAYQPSNNGMAHYMVDHSINNYLRPHLFVSVSVSMKQTPRQSPWQEGALDATVLVVPWPVWMHVLEQARASRPAVVTRTWASWRQSQNCDTMRKVEQRVQTAASAMTTSPNAMAVWCMVLNASCWCWCQCRKGIRSELSHACKE